MPIKKQSNWKNFFSFLLYMLTYVVILSVLIALPIRAADYFHWYLYTGLRAFLILFANISAIFISSKLIGSIKPKPLFTNFRDGVVISISWLLFFLIAFSIFDIKDAPAYLFMLSFFLAILVAVFFSYLLGTDELKLKIRNYPKMFKRKRVRKSKREKTHEQPTDS